MPGLCIRNLHRKSPIRSTAFRRCKYLEFRQLLRPADCHKDLIIPPCRGAVQLPAHPLCNLRDCEESYQNRCSSETVPELTVETPRRLYRQIAPTHRRMRRNEHSDAWSNGKPRL